MKKSYVGSWALHSVFVAYDVKKDSRMKKNFIYILRYV